jgi:tRNA pseudouridine38-40 synthase
VTEPAPALIRAVVTLAYDGTGYSGWARQPDLRTLQGDIEAALTSVDRRIGSVVCAGRTDSGVHARNQVFHVDLPMDLWLNRGPDGLVRQLNQLTDDRIHVRSVVAAPAGFDARFSALSRTYTYRICDDPLNWDPLFRPWVTHHRRELDVAAMAKAAPALVGEHDFAAFCRPRDGASTIRRILRLDVHRDGGRRAVITVEADAFCHSMVRSLVGALVAVGEGRRDPQWVAGVLATAERDSAVTVMPPQGLVLESVAYPPDELVAERAAATRRFRGPAGD